MRYIGGKSRIASKIETAILDNSSGRTNYLEPFLGGASVFEKLSPHFEKTSAGDLSEDLILMWRAGRDGWIPPENISVDQYESLRNMPPSALRGLVGFGGSFGGKWFGGYARGGIQSNGEPRNHQWESARAMIRISKTMKNSVLECLSYDRWFQELGSVIYCDPPYQDTESYAAVESFDHQAFWEKMNIWSTGSEVFVSEYNAPEGWVSIMESPHKMSLTLTSQGRPATIEKLFKHE